MRAWPTPQDDREANVFSLWRGSGIRSGSAAGYSDWVRRFRSYCRSHRLNELSELTLSGANVFLLAYRGPRLLRRRPGNESCALARVALHSWAFALGSLGESVPEWKPPSLRPRLHPLVVAYSEFRKIHRGVGKGTLVRDVAVTSEFLAHLRFVKKGVATARVADIDSFVEEMGKRICRRMVATNCSVLRCFLRFLLTTGRIRKDLATSVIAPRYRSDESPPRVLPWEDVRKILRAIPHDTSVGRRDYAMLLLMATYGLGGGEIVRMCLGDVYWKERVLRIRRAKTGVPIELPLLPAVARSLAAYLKHGRPRHATVKEIFVTTGMPHRNISSSVLRHQTRVYANRAGLKHEILGSHLFRRSHATRQIDWGVSHKVLADILGHRKPASTSVYIRVAFQRLRAISLPVPR